MSKLNTIGRLANHHATVIEVDGIGILIEGRSGAGKTSLALGLIEHFKTNEKSACLVGDDQVLVDVRITDGKQILMAFRPDSIAGKVEVRGFGIIDVASKANCKIDLGVKLIPDEKVERMPEAKYCHRRNIRLPYLEVPERHEAQSIRIVMAKLNVDF